MLTAGQILRLPPVLFVLFLVGGAVVHAFRPLAIGLPFGAAIGIGAALLAVAVALAWAALALMKRHGTTSDPGASATTLVTDGVFALSRNPLYIANPLVLLAIGVMLDSLTILVAAAVLWIALDRLVVPGEEKHLEQSFGDEYRAYRRRVRRWL